MPITLTGATGVDSPGFTENGDPIVESGSNSDGEWTRWSDGTQFCALAKPLGSGVALGDGTSSSPFSTNDASWTYPITFNAIPVLGGTALGSVYNSRAAFLNFQDYGAETFVTSIFRGVRVGSGDFNSDVVANLTAYGRWK